MDIITYIIVGILVTGFLSLQIWLFVKLHEENMFIHFRLDRHRIDIKCANTQRILNDVESDMLHTKELLFTKQQKYRYETIREELIDKKNELMDNGQYN